jgi:maltose alpha-D-glucosyltransferase/alpha-amylase
MIKEQLKALLSHLYVSTSDNAIVSDTAERLWKVANEFKGKLENVKDDRWYEKATVYSTYVDVFATDFNGLTEKLSYLEELGITGLWLLPCLSSPMRDQGFDISDFEKIRPALLGEKGEGEFARFLDKANEKGINVIFDITLNHCSDEHSWFTECRKNWFHWSDTSEKYKGARLLFKGIVDSNWEYSEKEQKYFFHRFYPFQPDLNYGNPDVLVEMISILLRWKEKGISGFRLDAIPFLWKKTGTSCENLSETHSILKILRLLMDYAAPHTLLLAEACQPPAEVVKYFGDGDECNSAYHFPLMPMIFLSLATGDGSHIREILNEKNTPSIPENSTWFTFLRCHDELTLEMVSKEERELLYNHYCHDEEWSFRCGEGISSRLFNLLSGNIDKLCLIYGLLHSLPGTPILYYGDEIGLENDHAFFDRKSKETGFRDSRFLVRGKMDWSLAEKIQRTKHQEIAEDQKSAEGIEQNGRWRLFNTISNLIKLRKEKPVLGTGELSFPELTNNRIFVIERTKDKEKLIALFNLTENEEVVARTDKLCGSLTPLRTDCLSRVIIEEEIITLPPHSFIWLYRLV